MFNETKRVGMAHFLVAGIADGLQFVVNFLHLFPVIGTILASMVSFAITLGTFLTFGIFFGTWFPVTFFGETIPVINGLPFWTARVMFEAAKERAPAAAPVPNKK
ncbi:MAG: hypothetical protein U1D31_02975 [Patescibacteria group bacterium]|nr:hypothetical protein [Patescibacteria group bacterium]